MYDIQNLADAIKAELQKSVTIPNSRVHMVPVSGEAAERTEREVYQNLNIVEIAMQMESAAIIPIPNLESFFQQGTIEVAVAAEYAQWCYDNLVDFVQRNNAKTLMIGSGNDVYKVLPAYDMPSVGTTDYQEKMGYMTNFMIYSAFTIVKGGVMAEDVTVSVNIDGTDVALPITRAALDFVANTDNNQIVNKNITASIEESQNMTLAVSGQFVTNAAYARILGDRLKGDASRVYAVTYNDTVISFTRNMLVTSVGTVKDAGTISTISITFANAYEEDA